MDILTALFKGLAWGTVLGGTLIIALACILVWGWLAVASIGGLSMVCWWIRRVEEHDRRR